MTPRSYQASHSVGSASTAARSRVRAVSCASGPPTRIARSAPSNSLLAFGLIRSRAVRGPVRAVGAVVCLLPPPPPAGRAPRTARSRSRASPGHLADQRGGRWPVADPLARPRLLLRWELVGGDPAERLADLRGGLVVDLPLDRLLGDRK